MIENVGENPDAYPIPNLPPGVDRKNIFSKPLSELISTMQWMSSSIFATGRMERIDG
jgi:hypothetical protein